MTLSAELQESDNPAPVAVSERAMLLDRYEIDPSAEISALSRPGANAYSAVDRKEPARPVYAVIPNTGLPIRLRAYHQSRQMENTTFTRLIRTGSVKWPLTGRHETVLIVPSPPGKPLMESLDTPIAPVPHNNLIRTILPPIADMIEEMTLNNVAHRAIRPDNIFVFGDNEQFTVGECFSVPAGMAQPACFEPLERAMCLPEGRGEGDVADDMFALGMTTLVLALGQNPVAGIDPQTLLQNRRQMGSYAALVNKMRVPTELIQMLRALLRDESADRWTVENLQAWLSNGRGVSWKVPPTVECTRSFEFGEEKFKSAPTLAYAMGSDWPAAIEVCKSDEIEKWLETSLKDKCVNQALTKCKLSIGGGPRAVGDDLLLARMLQALDPDGPLRYREITVMPDGIGTLLAATINDSTRLKSLIDLLQGQLPAFCMELKNRPNYAMMAADEEVARVMPLLHQQAAGFGIERVLYELNPGLMCRSSYVANANCADISQLLKALDSSVADNEAIYDRHIAAFVGARVSGSIDRDLNDIALSDQPGAKLLVQLRLFAYLQGKSDAFELPGLCEYFLGKSPAIIETFRNVELRADLTKKVRSAAGTGNLGKLEKVLGDRRLRRWDTNGFNAAQRQHSKDDTELRQLQESFATIPQRSHKAGKQIGAFTAGAMSLAATAIVLVTQMI